MRSILQNNRGSCKTPGLRKIDDFELLYSSTFGNILDQVGPKCGAVKQLKRAILMSLRVLQFPLTYKAEMQGKQVAYVDPRYTSQKCSSCKASAKKNRNKSKYRCKNCKFRIHADWNAAINIRDNYILSSTPKAPEEQAAVNQPYVTIGNSQSQAYCLVQ